MMDKLADPAHPLWKFLRVLAVLAATLFVFQFAYQHKIGMVDILPIITIIGTVAGFDLTKAAIVNKLQGP